MASHPLAPPSTLPSNMSGSQTNGHANINVINEGGSTAHIGDKNEGNMGILGSNNVGNKVEIRVGGKEELDRMLGKYISRDALHDYLHAPRECHPKTRTTVQRAITTWIESSESPSPILWLYGPAGVGKSVIAKTIAVTHRSRVVAAFFFSTSSNRTAETLFPTLAWQLAYNIPQSRPHIVDALAKNCSLPTSHLQQQFELLIAEPLKKINITTSESTPGPGPIMLIDGVDECTDDELRNQFLKILERSGTMGKTKLRFIICSRPEPSIRGILHKAPIPNNHVPVVVQAQIPQGNTVALPGRVVVVPGLSQRIRKWIKPYLSGIKRRLNSTIKWRLQDVAALLQEVRELYRPFGREEVNVHQPAKCSDEFDEISPHPIISRIQIGHSPESKADIKIYLEDEFQAIGRQRDLGSWFEPDDVEYLVRISCGQFLYASTIVRLAEDDSQCPATMLEMIRACCLPDLRIDNLYEAILNKQVCQRTLKDVLSLLVVFSENIHFANVTKNIPIIEALLAPDRGWQHKSLGRMHSLLRISEDSVGVYHRSFLEFLQNTSRSTSYWYISYPVALGDFVSLLMKAAFRYTFKRFFWRLGSNDGDKLGSLQSMVLAYPRNSFKRSRNPTLLSSFHALAHSVLILLVWVPICLLRRPSLDSLIYLLTHSPILAFVIRYLLTTFSFVFFSCLYFVVSLVCYQSCLKRFIIFPFFHPFLHPYLVKSVELLSTPPLYNS